MQDFDPATFFSEIRASIFGNRLSQSQVDGVNVLLSAWEKWGTGNDSMLADVLGQITRETGMTMQPVREAFGTSTADTIKRLDRAYAAGKLTWVKAPYWRDGWFGRGYIQITHKDNYAKMERILGIPLTSKPDLALDPEISAHIAIEGMTRGASLKGDFTGKALIDFTDLETRKVNHAAARAVVNGRESSAVLKQIVGYCEAYEDAIAKAREAAARIKAANVAPAKVETSERSPWLSTTNWAAGTAVLAGTAQASDQVKKIMGNVTEAFGIDPAWFLIAVLALAAGWITKERLKKAHLFGV